ncbi:MAG TPA: Hpt domain-containing protein [Puia sp.]|uniref:Hpt domain-containing protein n=1 Tax=Puia sp. TaxID=2045100 RepID=UPI002CC90F7E|nr:Hpt domain-containing protein [Puia sp.]HVU95890.1 Hpt domain-containing protein [Puia sp.]
MNKKIAANMQNFRTGFVFDESLNASFLAELFDGDTTYAETVFEDFLRDLPVYWDRVEAAYESKDLPVLGTSVHTCKTLFGYVGFTDLQDLCQQFENKCSVNTAEELRLDYIRLIQRKEKAQHIIEKEYDRLRKFNTANG